MSDPWKKENLLDSLWQLAWNNRDSLPPHHFALLELFCKSAKGWGLEHRKKTFWAFIGLYLHRGQKPTVRNVNAKVSCFYCGLESNLLYILSDYNDLVYLMEMLTEFQHNSAGSDRWDPQKLQMQTTIGGKTKTIVPCWLPPPPEEYDCWYNVARRTPSSQYPASSSTDIVPELLLAGLLAGIPGASQWRLAPNQSAAAAAASRAQWRLAPGQTAAPAPQSAAAAPAPPAAAPVQQLAIEDSQPTLSSAAFSSSNSQPQPESVPQPESEPSWRQRWARRNVPPPPPPPPQHGDEAAVEVPPPPPPPPQHGDEAAVEVPQPKQRPRHRPTSKRSRSV